MLRCSAPFAAVAVFVVTGCGSSSTKTVTVSTTSAAAPATLTKAQFIAKADDVCRALMAQQKPLKARAAALGGTADPTPAVRLLREDVALARAANLKLRALPVPSGDASQIKRLLDGFDEEDTDANNLANALASGKGEGVRVATATAEKAMSFDHGLAQGYGFKVCGASE